jgi:hypothetical protein
MVSLMLVLNRSLLNREYILINFLKALASIISVRNLHITFLSKVTPDSLRYLLFRPFSEDGTQAVDDCEKSKSPESCLHLF